MEPTNIAYDICQRYIRDQAHVDPALISYTDGLRRARDFAGLASCSLRFDLASHTVNDWRFLRQVEAFFKKNANLAVAKTCRDTALQSFKDCEIKCSETNLRLRPYVMNQDQPDPKTLRLVRRMQRYISNVLGDFRLFLNEVPHLVKVTPGATAQSSRRDSLPQLKLKLKLHATRGAFKYLRALYAFYGFRQPRLRAVTSNRIELVPKNWKTDRTIACEPEGNLPLQLAVDTYVKRRLRRFKINLSDQSANQRLAKHASINNDFVTVDFASASDTISFNTVSWLIPPDWFRYLLDIRSPAFRSEELGDGVYSKFSSMGNGYTFVLETLIFAAACYAVGSKKFLVYGDDVIIEAEHYESFTALTRFLGFTVNAEKSFHDGPFRESCGADWFNGIDVTPTYIRSIDGRKVSLCHLVNTVGSLTFPEGHLEAYLLSLIEDYKLPLVPFNESSLSGVWITPDEARARGILRRCPSSAPFPAEKLQEVRLDTSSDEVTQKRFRSAKDISAYRKCCGKGIDYTRYYLPQSKERPFVDSRGYYLWFLYKNSQVLFGGPWELTRPHYDPSQTSSATVFQHKYVRKRVCWHPPAAAVPDHVILWSGKLFGPPRKGPAKGHRG